MKDIKLKGKDAEAKLAHVETILRRMTRRLHKTIVGYIPPIPVFGEVTVPNENGDIMNKIMPAHGNISRLVMAVGSYKDNKPVGFTVQIKGSAGGHYVSFVTKRSIEIADVDISVKPGDILSLSTDDPKAITDIYAAALFHIDKSEGRFDEISIDALEQLIEEDLEDEGV